MTRHHHPKHAPNNVDYLTLGAAAYGAAQARRTARAAEFTAWWITLTPEEQEEWRGEQARLAEHERQRQLALEAAALERQAQKEAARKARLTFISRNWKRLVAGIVAAAVAFAALGILLVEQYPEDQCGGVGSGFYNGRDWCIAGSLIINPAWAWIIIGPVAVAAVLYGIKLLGDFFERNSKASLERTLQPQHDGPLSQPGSTAARRRT